MSIKDWFEVEDTMSDDEFNALIERDGAILASVTTLEELEASQLDIPLRLELGRRMASAGGDDTHSGASMACVRDVAYRILLEVKS